MAQHDHPSYLAILRAMSALPPKADSCGAATHVRFGPKADSCTAAILSLFDRLVGVGEEGRRYFQANCFRSPEVDHELKLRRLHHRRVRWLGTLQNLSGVDALLANGIDNIGCIAD